MRPASLTVGLFATLLALPVHAQLDPPRATLLADIGPTIDAGSDPAEFTSVGVWCYFVATYGREDRELYRTDGRTGSADLVVDLRPGWAGSHPNLLTAVGGLLMFFADDGQHGRELYASDGTAAGTRRIDLFPSSDSANPLEMTGVNGRAVFVLEEAGQNTLWVSDGTSAGTRRVLDAPQVRGAVLLLSGAEPAPGGGELVWFADYDFYGASIWVSDGTDSGTRLVGALGVRVLGIPVRGVSATPGHFVFEATGAAADLWAADLQAGTVTPLGTGETHFGHPVRFDGRALFPIFSRFGVVALASDGVTTTPVTVTGTTAAGTSFYGSWNGSLWMAVGDDRQARLDAGSTNAVAVGSGTVPPDGGRIARAGARFFFEGLQPERGLVEIDVASGTSRRAFPGAIPALGSHLGSLLFSGDDPDIGAEPWRLGDTQRTPELLANLSPGWQSYDSQPRGYTRYGEHVVFHAETPGLGREPWITDGTPAHTRLLADLVPGPDGVDNTFHTVGDELWIVARSGRPRHVFVWDGGPNPPVRIADLASTSTVSQVVIEAAPFGDGLLFTGTIGTDTGLFRLGRDGTTTFLATTTQIDPTVLVNGDRAFFAGYLVGTADVGLWITEGTPATTHFVGAVGSGGKPSLAVYDGRLWVGLTSGLYWSDGQSIHHFASWYGPHLVVAGEYLYGVSNWEIYRTDGSPGNTTSATHWRQFRPATARAFGSRVICNTSGIPLVSDGTQAGTRWVAPGIYLASVDATFAVTGSQRAWFGGYEPLTPGVLGVYVTDGTPAGTRRMSSTPMFPTDQPGLPYGSTLALANGRLFLTGNDEAVGVEPFVLDVGAVGETVGTPCTGSPTRDVTLRAFAEPALGTDLHLLGRAPGSTAAMLLLALPPQLPLPVTGTRCALHIDPGSLDALGPFATDPQGGFRATLPLPTTPALIGFTASFQAAFAPDPGPLGVALSPGLRLRLADH